MPGQGGMPPRSGNPGQPPRREFNIRVSQQQLNRTQVGAGLDCDDGNMKGHHAKIGVSTGWRSYVQVSRLFNRVRDRLQGKTVPPWR